MTDHDTPRWYRIDEQRFAVAAAQHAVRCLVETQADRQQLPWAVIALHNATQAAMIAHLTGTAGIGALDRKSADDVLSAIRDGSEYPTREYVARFSELLRRLRRADRQIEHAGGEVALLRAELNALRLLNTLRNEFVHFSPKGWSLEISGLPRMVLACATILRGVYASGWSLLHLEGDEAEAYEVAIRSLERLGASDAW